MSKFGRRSNIFGKPLFGIPTGEQIKMVANRMYCLLDGYSPKFLVFGVGMMEGEDSELSFSR